MKSSVALLLLLSCSPCKMEVQSDGHESRENQSSLQVQQEDGEKRKSKRDTEEQITDKGASDGTTSILQSCQSSVVTFLLTQMSSMEERLRTSEKQLEELQKKSNGATVETQVAFSAALLGSGVNENTGPFNTKVTLKYRHVITNIGNAYNPDTGIFTAPVKGVYKFEIFAYAEGSDSYPVTVSIIKNAQEVFMIHGHQRAHAVNASNGASLLMEAGDVVYVQLWENRIIMDNAHCHSTFSGHLLFRM
ncbi:hypothetical protein P4O66_007197 [Electrophorus voltai]|uniref:C1q domain-containing protein n=1 Tax=Electrophorus voltai TaxID=2609070 RepID=A0AAD8ZIX6_9TELE|nr:hypothetical protein P4O66_007197 [Electrophorus voltai]